MKAFAAALLVLCVACDATGVVTASPTAATGASVTGTASIAPTATARPTPTPGPLPMPESGVLAQIDAATLDEHLRVLTSFQSRHPLHPGHAKAVAYLMDQLSAIPGVVVQDIPTQYNGVRLDNILATINPLPGSGSGGFRGGVALYRLHFDSTADRT